jgi:hypothetical protein
MVEGVLVANGVPDPDATRFRPVLAAAAAGEVAEVESVAGPGHEAEISREAEIVVPPLVSVAAAA